MHGLLERTTAAFMNEDELTQTELTEMTRRIAVGKPIFAPRPPNPDDDEVTVKLDDGQVGVLDTGATGPWVDSARLRFLEWAVRQRQRDSDYARSCMLHKMQYRPFAYWCAHIRNNGRGLRRKRSIPVDDEAYCWRRDSKHVPKPKPKAKLKKRDEPPE